MYYRMYEVRVIAYVTHSAVLYGVVEYHAMQYTMPYYTLGNGIVEYNQVVDARHGLNQPSQTHLPIPLPLPLFKST